MDKKSLILTITKLGDSMGNDHRELDSIVLCKKILQLDAYNNARKILTFMIFGGEVEIGRLNAKILEENEILYLPSVEKDGTLSIVEHGEGFSMGSYGIREPMGANYLGNLDFIITPGLAFDLEGNRLGYGEGYYDKLFRNHFSTLEIASIFAIQLVKGISYEAHDIEIDMIITNNEILSIKTFRENLVNMVRFSIGKN